MRWVIIVLSCLIGLAFPLVGAVGLTAVFLYAATKRLSRERSIIREEAGAEVFDVDPDSGAFRFTPVDEDGNFTDLDENGDPREVFAEEMQERAALKASSSVPR